MPNRSLHTVLLNVWPLRSDLHQYLCDRHKGPNCAHDFGVANVSPNDGVTKSRQTEDLGCFSRITSTFQPFKSQDSYRVWLTLQVLLFHQSFSPPSLLPSSIDPPCIDCVIV